MPIYGQTWNAVYRLPNELWDRILGEATAFTWDDKLDDPFVLSHKDVSAFTRKSVMLVSRRFYRMASRHIYRDLRIQERQFFDETIKRGHLQFKDCNAVSQLRALASTIRTRTQEGRALSLHQTSSLVVHSGFEPEEMEKAGMDLCFILTHCSRLTVFGTNMSPEDAPWLDVLVETSYKTLTHLDIDIDHEKGRHPGVLEAINILQNLVWLRISDMAEWGDGDWTSPSSLHMDSLPVLALQSLRFLEVISSRDGTSLHIPFHIASHAVLPRLTSLRIRGHAVYDYDGTPILAQLGATLEDLHISLPDEDILDRIHTLAPRLRNLTFIIGEDRLDEDPGDMSTCVLKHPTLRRLTLHGYFVFEPLFLSLQRADVPQLEYVRLHDLRWHSWHDLELEPLQEFFKNAEMGVRVAFGGLSNPVVRQWATRDR